MSNPNRRQSFRASLSQVRNATLFCGRRPIDVQVVDESSGGFSVTADAAASIEIESEVELRFHDGDAWMVQVKHLESRGVRICVGLQRLRHVSTRGKLCRKASHANQSASIGAFGIVLAVMLGYLLGANGIRLLSTGDEANEPANLRAAAAQLGSPGDGGQLTAPPHFPQPKLPIRQ
jgi:hypothetical protein